MAGRIGGKGEVMFLGGVAEMIEDDSGLDAGDAALGIKLEDLRHVFRKVEDYGEVAALSRERRASSTAEHGCIVLAGDGDGGDDIIGISGNNHTDWNLPVIGSVGCIESTAAIIEADLAADLAAQSGFE
jgi:hypothetical protein